MTPFYWLLVGAYVIQAVFLFWFVGKAGEERERLINLIVAKNPQEYRRLQQADYSEEHHERPEAVHPIGL